MEIVPSGAEGREQRELEPNKAEEGKKEWEIARFEGDIPGYHGWRLFCLYGLAVCGLGDQAGF